MHAMHTPPFVGQAEIRTTARFFGRATGPWLAARERQQVAMDMAEQAWLLRCADGAIAAPSLVQRTRRAIGAALVRTGLHRRATTGAPAAATQP
jgi:hypothetical protein